MVPVAVQMVQGSDTVHHSREPELSGCVFQVLVYDDGHGSGAWRIWKLIPVSVEGVFAPSQPSFNETLGPGSLPPYDGNATRQSSAHTRPMESDGNEFGTIVNEVTVLTTTVTTRKRYWVEET